MYNDLFTKYSRIFTKSNSSNLLIAAPHHAIEKYDDKKMRTLRGTKRSYDVNTGFIAIKIAEAFDSNYIIFANARKDPNKIVNGRYCNFVKRHKDCLLIEIHGHSSNYIADDLIEISSGSMNADVALIFAEMLQNELDKTEFSNYKVEGDYNKLFYKASKTPTINGEVHNNENTNYGLQIEIPYSLRSDDKYIAFTDCLIKTIKTFTNDRQ